MFGTYEALAVGGGHACYLYTVLEDVAQGIYNNGHTHFQLSESCCSIAYAALLGQGHSAGFPHSGSSACTHIPTEWRVAGDGTLTSLIAHFTVGADVTFAV